MQTPPVAGDAGAPQAQDPDAASDPAPAPPIRPARATSARTTPHRHARRRADGRRAARYAGPGARASDPSEFRAPALLPRERPSTASRVGEELLAWLKTLASAAVYATLIVTFGFQVARVEGLSMAPTLADQDRLIVNKLAYRIGEPQVGDIVMLYYPLNPEKSFVKRVIAEEGDQVRIVDGRVFRNDVPIDDAFVPTEYRSHDDWGPQVVPRGLLLRDGRPPEQQLRQPPLGLRAEEVHHRQGAAALVADAARAACSEPVRSDATVSPSLPEPRSVWPHARAGSPASSFAFWC